MGLGKWIAGALGWAFLGPIGGILAFYFASMAEEASYVQGEQAKLQGQRNSFLMSLLVLSAAAEEKFKAVNQAYEAICKERGI